VMIGIAGLVCLAFYYGYYGEGNLEGSWNQEPSGGVCQVTLIGSSTAT
jgi:hypothetical protein